MTRLHETATVGQLVVDRPSRARVFERFGIDYCCGGKTPLREACEQLGLDLQAVLAALHAADAESSTTPEQDWAGAPLGALVGHIVSTHHAYLRSELPRLTDLAEKTERAHGPRHPELSECRRVFASMRAELESHTLKEEQILFPALSNMEATPRGSTSFIGSVRAPIRVMVEQHDSAAQALRTLRQLTNDFTAPEDACNTWRALLDGLKRLEADLHQHIHMENNILFPRAIELEASHSHATPSATAQENVSQD